MRNIRPFGWVIIVLNVYFLYALFNGVSQLDSDGSGDTATGIYIFMFIIIWALINIVLYVLYRVTGGKRRECPACGNSLKKGLTVCPSCNFDFMKAANGASQN